MRTCPQSVSWVVCDAAATAVVTTRFELVDVPKSRSARDETAQINDMRRNASTVVVCIHPSAHPSVRLSPHPRYPVVVALPAMRGTEGYCALTTGMRPPTSADRVCSMTCCAGRISIWATATILIGLMSRLSALVYRSLLRDVMRQ
jgi:hypothetical protein